MGYYEQKIFNRMCDASLDTPAVNATRKKTLERATGEILEIGMGTGLNLPNYPESVRRVRAITLNDALDERAEARARAAGITVEHTRGDAARLPIDAGSIDTVVCTFLFCSVDDPSRFAAEIARVLSPGGRLLFHEHVLAPSLGRQIVQYGFLPMCRLMNLGCRPTRRTGELLARTFEIEDIEERDEPGMALPLRSIIHGSARRR